MAIDPGKELLPFEAMLDAWLVRRNDQQQKERAAERGTKKTAFYMSELGYGARKIFLTFIEEIKRDSRKTGQNMRVFANGDYVQKRYSDWFKEMGVWVNEEVPYNTYDRADVPVLVSGRADLIIDYYKFYGIYHDLVRDGWLDPELFPLPDAPPPKEGDLAIIEMKSINSWGFKDKAKTGAPEWGHLYQISMYQWLSGIHIGWILYEEKDRQQVGAFPVVFNEIIIYGDGSGRITGILNELESIKKLIDNRELPPKCPGASATKFPCKWGTGQCDYFAFCWQSDEVIPPATPDNVVEFGGMTITLPEGATFEDIERVKHMLAGATVSQSEPETQKTTADYVGEMKTLIDNFTAEKPKTTRTRKKSAGALISEELSK